MNSNPSSAIPLWRPALGLSVLSLLLFGLAYPLACVSLAQGLFPAQAQGQLLLRDGRVVGALQVGQAFSAPHYLIGRPSAAGYDPRAAAGSNMAVSNPALAERVATTLGEVSAREGVAPSQVPADAVLASGAGLDPHITPAYAALQLPRLARSRGVAPDAVQSIIDGCSEGRQFGMLGQPRVNVLCVNLALDAQAPVPAPDRQPSS